MNWLKELLSNPRTSKLSIARIAFFLILFTCIFTTIKWKMIVPEWVTIITIIIPYMFLDKQALEGLKGIKDKLLKKKDPTIKSESKD